MGAGGFTPKRRTRAAVGGLCGTLSRECGAFSAVGGTLVTEGGPITLGVCRALAAKCGTVTFSACRAVAAAGIAAFACGVA